ncbi:MAG: SpoIIE family protein phosphatase [Spirochaetes bacterium]|nr:SpoIIE family protein phosphatase [Spirochaetota bacterium]
MKTHPRTIDLDVVVNSITEGLYIVDTDRRILYWNRGAEQITGWKAEEVVGSFCRDGILEHADSADHKLCHSGFCPLYRSIHSGKSLRVSSLVRTLTRKGKRVPVEVTTSPYRDGGGRIIGGIEVFRDMSAAMAEMQAARLIQRDAITLSAPTGGRASFEVAYHPRDLVGGDFVRIEKLDKSQFAFLLADVTSHGVSAALFTLLLRSLWEEHAHLWGGPLEAASHLNSRLGAYGSENGYFASALFGLLDAEAPSLAFCSAGSPPFLRREAGGRVTVHEATGHLLGAEEDPGYEKRSLALARGDRLLFFTDGAFEAENAAGEPAGIERLAERFARMGENESLDEFCARVEEDLLAYSGLLQLPDDFTAVLVRLIE